MDSKKGIPSGRLAACVISFSEEIMELDDGKLNFYINTDFNVDSVFGTNVCTTENDDWLNVYANYDMATGEVCDTLDISLHRGDGGEEELSYPINSAEKEMLIQKMDEYSMEQTGMGLKEYVAHCMADTQQWQPTM